MSKYKMPMILGMVGGLLALVGTFLPWLNICASALGISMCLPFSGMGISGAMATYGAGGVSPILGIAPLLILLFGIIGLVMMLLKKPMMNMLGLVMGLLVVLMAILWVVSLGSLTSQIPTGAGVSVGAGFGVWLSLIGGVLLLVGGLMGMKALKGTAPPAPGAPM